MKKQSLYILSIILIITLSGFKYPAKVNQVLEKAGNNRTELEKVLEHYQKDSLKFKAACFLIENMDIHYSSDYYWADTMNIKLNYNELAYPDFNSSLNAFDSLKQKHKGVHPIPVRYMDYDTIGSSLLIEHIDKSIASWQSGSYRQLPFNNFCEYLLPYRISMEPLHNWYGKYNSRFRYINDTLAISSAESFNSFLRRDLSKWFLDSYGIQKREEPLPRLGALQLLHRKKGACEDIVDLEVFMLRSQGIPATVDFVPFWATSTGRHWMNVWFDNENNPHHLDVTSTNGSDKLVREPAKVFRVTYSKQADNLTSILAPDNIPEGFMRTDNYVDVTREYWEVRDIKCSLFKSTTPLKVAYACVINSLNWQPAHWGKIVNDTVVFHDMSQGAVYLPMYYQNKKLVPAGYPVVSDYDETYSLIPDTLSRRTIAIAEEEKYLAFRPGKKYTLFYWNNKWIKAGTQVATENSKELWFDLVPRNALLLLIPEYTQRKERPFYINDKGVRKWW